MRVPTWQRTLSKQDRQTIGWTLLLHVAVLFPLLIADRYHVDDWGRAVLGYFNWANDGRPWADWLMRRLDQGAPFTDCSPLPQLFAFLLLGLTVALVAKRLGSGPPLTSAIAGLLLGANPFFLANLSFKFDSLPMTLALFLGTGAVVLLNPLQQRPVLTGLAGTIFLFGSLCLYQPCTSAFCVLVLFEIVIGQRAQMSPIQLAALLLLRVTQMFIALLIYKFLVAAHIKGEYAIEHSPLVSGSSAAGDAWHNAVAFWSLVPSAATGNLRWPLLAAPALAFCYMLGIGFNYIIRSWRSSSVAGIISLGLVFAFLVGCVFAAPGILVLIKAPTGGARTYVGVSVLFFASACLLISGARRIKLDDRIVICLTALLVLPVAIFSATYANATKTQKYYEAHIATLISDDLLQLVKAGPKSHLTIIGDVGFAPVVQRIYLKKYPFLGALVPIDLRADASGGFGNTVLRFWGVPWDKYARQSDRDPLVRQLAPENLVKETPYYDINVINQDVVLRLKSSSETN
jgi:Glucosyl transferase GtrII